ncbi:unnamed protein product [Paramecium sonneborni]|uniref:Uncharacterized protein n=1 Tax=Paramecium sonneborni TaxID=65129 RepID=A0A8S1N1J7_9CILI|nr:unnamed protein product [Paramecium sonneborni]
MIFILCLLIYFHGISIFIVGIFQILESMKMYKIFRIKQIPFKYQIVIEGNHYTFVDTKQYEEILKDIFIKDQPCHHLKLQKDLKENSIQLENSSVNIEGYKIWEKYSPTILNYSWVFQVDSEDGGEFWKIMEEGSDFDGAPLGHGSYVHHYQRMKHQQKQIKK